MKKTKNIKVKFVVAALAICLSALVSMLTAFAVELPAGSVGKLAVLGDAVSYGSGLDDRAGKCYGALTASALKLGESGYINLSTDKASSSDLADALSKGEINISEADLAVVSIGGEEILSVLRETLSSLGVASYGELVELGKTGELVRKLNAAVDYQTLLNNAAKYSANIEKIISGLRYQNPEIRIVFLTLYDPLSGIEDLVPVANLYAPTLELMNRELESTVLGKGCYLIDLSEAFSSRSAELTNITSFAVTPSEAGHKLIAELLCELAATLPKYSSETEENTEAPDPAETEDVSEKSNDDITTDSKNDPLDAILREKKSGIVFYIAGAVVIGVLGIAVGAFAEAKRKRYKK